MDTGLIAVFAAATDGEIDEVETLLDGAGIKYEVRLEASERMARGVCFQQLVFAVAPERAGESRRLIEAAGFERGVIPQPE